MITFVRPHPNSTAMVAMVLSTFTYFAYANEHMYDVTKSSPMDVPNGTTILEDDNYKNMVKRSDLGLSLYDVHLDGSGCTFSTSSVRFSTFDLAMFTGVFIALENLALSS